MSYQIVKERTTKIPQKFKFQPWKIFHPNLIITTKNQLKNTYIRRFSSTIFIPKLDCNLQRNVPPEKPTIDFDLAAVFSQTLIFCTDIYSLIII